MAIVEEATGAKASDSNPKPFFVVERAGNCIWFSDCRPDGEEGTPTATADAASKRFPVCIHLVTSQAKAIAEALERVAGDDVVRRAEIDANDQLTLHSWPPVAPESRPRSPSA